MRGCMVSMAKGVLLEGGQVFGFSAASRQDIVSDDNGPRFRKRTWHWRSEASTLYGTDSGLPRSKDEVILLRHSRRPEE